ncbi:hypothetical protein SAMN06269117_11467 [Balnearium lithotrophicum]|uniref:Uncharacterized protein n=1 Tax=Balnearium lithotrophicum TaxID=223788 RepID=A0A521CRI4_9BACT|nr:hypothetical protein [Balnearium lithotrophicum]SMO62018.1 hypothetical protein SAMN06269117_11467 [Balnearium lithotrophicum]
MRLAEKVEKLLGEKLDIEGVIKEFYPDLSGLKQARIRRVGDVVKWNGEIIGIYLGNGNLLTAEPDGVCVVPVPKGSTFWRK